MNKLTSLHSECLANMPMMLDVMTNTIETLSELLNPQYDRIEEYLTEFFDKHKKLRCQLDESWERGTVYAFTDHVTRYKKRYLLELMPALELYYCIPFSKTTKNGVSFYVHFGYYTDGEDYNEVYFGLGETDSAQHLTDEWIEKIKTESAGDWEIYTNNGYIEFQITPDDQLTDEKIARCGEDFKNRILKPLLEQLQ